MKASTLQTKTVRPGSLNGLSYYYSKRPEVLKPAKARSPNRRRVVLALILLVIIMVPLTAYNLHVHNTANPLTTFSQVTDQNSPGKASPLSKPNTSAPATATVANNCTGNSLSQFVKVSISQRHMWACQGGTQVYDSPVVTGIEYLAADLTPTGTYHIYAKETDQTLTGHDSTGSWNDHVSYWMPFLENQYGTYGFHDATWRAPSDFGNIDPNSSNASHGCVELPLSTATWLYNWVHIGTTVTIVS